jgi:hypothetical protein
MYKLKYAKLILPAALYACETLASRFENMVLRIFALKMDELIGDLRTL